MMNVKDKIEQQLTHKIVLYMKGTPIFPQCGFSSRSVAILAECFKEIGQTSPDILYVNVLEDDEIREGIKTYGNWPTIPQLYLNGELVGGSDIMTELYERKELAGLIEEALVQKQA